MFVLLLRRLNRLSVTNQDFVVLKTDKQRTVILVKAKIDDWGFKLVFDRRRGEKGFVMFGRIQSKNFQEVLAFIFHLVHLGNCAIFAASNFNGLAIRVKSLKLGLGELSLVKLQEIAWTFFWCYFRLFFWYRSRLFEWPRSWFFSVANLALYVLNWLVNQAFNLHSLFDQILYSVSSVTINRISY